MSKFRRHNLRIVPGTPPCEEDAVSGRITHDSRGNAIWDWAISTGVLAKKTTTELLSSLRGSKAVTLELDPPVAPDRGCDPYNRRPR